MRQQNNLYFNSNKEKLNMSLSLESMHQSRKKAPRIEDGTYMARVSSIIDLGVQPQTDWQTGDATDSKPRVLFTWTLPTETQERELDDGTVETYARVISKEYTLSNHEKSNLVKIVKTLKPDLKSLNELLDFECMVSVGSTINGNAKVTNCVKAPKGMSIDVLERPPVNFDFDAPSEDAFMTLPNWIKGKITEAENYGGFADGWQTEEAA